MGKLIALAVRLAVRGSDALGIPLAAFALLAGLALGAGPTGLIAWHLAKARIAVEARAEANRLARDLAEARIDVMAARSAEIVARAALDRNAAAAAKARKRRDAYARELAGRGPAGACGFTDGDVRGMRGNAWAVEPGSGRPEPPAGR